jgi:methylated-DNA-[protein]-cysteine S-methyltransferase
MKPFDRHALQSIYRSPLGRMYVLANDHALLGLWFEGQEYFPALEAFASVRTHPVHDMAHAQLDAYFLQQRQVFSLPVDYSAGTDFQQAVWRQLTFIAPGQTTNYAAIALAIGNRAAVRAVGGAVGRNPLSIVVPCHRVIGSNGAMTGYAGGLPRKIALLQLESAI